MTLSEFFIITYEPDEKYQVRRRIYCNDGFSMSVQAGYGNYSKPRENGDTYTAYEIGYPSKAESLLMPHAEDADRPTDTVYGYVPFEVVEAVIEKHGGINVRLTFSK